jgi:two-component system KDP operon response regulator KdpE
VVDDEEAIRRLLKSVLTRGNYDVRLAANGDEALDCAAEFTPDLVILDLALPGLGGLEVCRELRAWLAAPILVLSGWGEQSAKISALDDGADDYLTKPFAIGELLARIRALLRRSSSSALSPVVFSSGELTVDMARRRVLRSEQEIRLTRTEFNILAALARNAGCVVTSRMLLEEVWGNDYGDTQTLRVHVGHLRKKVEPEPSNPRYILTEPGIGYWLFTPVISSQPWSTQRIYAGGVLL